MKNATCKVNKPEKSQATANATAKQKNNGQSTSELVDKRAVMHAQRELGEIISNSPKMTGQRLLNKQISNSLNSKDGVIQGAWIGRRGLAHSELLKWGVTGEHAGGLGIFHEHIFYEDDGEPANQGFGPSGVFTEGEEGYTKMSGGYNDEHMRWAAAAHMNNGEYSLTDNNCQQWVNKVLDTYYKFRQETPRSKVQEEVGIEMTEFSSNREVDWSQMPPGDYEMSEF